jgi:MFS family permease
MSNISPVRDDRLFTGRFAIMCGFGFAVFFSVFQLVPTTPFRMRDLGGSTLTAGLFTGLLTFASAASAPLTGALADRIGRRRTLIGSSLAITLFTLGYALTSSPQTMMAIVIVHGLFWSGLLSANGAYLTDLIPVRRRAEGIAYWGLTSVIATAAAPPIAFWLYERGGWLAICASCGVLNLAMAAIAWGLPETPHDAHAASGRGPMLEWRVLTLAGTLFLYSFGYGAITTFSALFAEAIRVTPRSVYLTALGGAMLLTRPFAGRVGDRLGYRRILIPCLAFIAVGMALLSQAESRGGLILSALVFGVGFGTAYPVFVAYVMRDVSAARRGAAFGAILAMFDTGIGAGSVASGWLIQRFGFSVAFGVGAALSAVSLPYFLAIDRRLSRSGTS